jgi:hypothetical protein
VFEVLAVAFVAVFGFVDRDAAPWVIHDKAAVQVIICAVDTLIAEPSST